MQSSHLVAFCIPYYGKFPIYMNLFFQTCGYQSNVHFLVFHEQPTTEVLPDIPNLHFIFLPYTQLINKANEVVGVQMLAVDTHKLCDLRPFYGLIFADYLKDYRYWGYCDTDVVFGDLSRVLQDDFLEGVDVFSAQENRIVGHFSVFKNTPKVNVLGFEIEEYQYKLEKVLGNTFLDERGITKVLVQHPEIRWKKTQSVAAECAGSFVQSHLTFNYMERISELPSSQGYEYVQWTQGQLYLWQGHKVVPCLYFHFMAMKLPFYWQKMAIMQSHSTFYLSRLGFTTVPPDWSAIETRWQVWKISAWVKAKILVGQLLRRMVAKNTKRQISLWVKKIF